MKRTTGLAALTVMLACGTASAQQVNVKIGVLSDMSSLYSDIAGPGSTAAAKLAAPTAGIKTQGAVSPTSP